MRDIRIQWWGAAGIVSIVAMLLVAAARQWQVNWIYLLLAVILFSLGIIIVTPLYEEADKKLKEKDRQLAQISSQQSTSTYQQTASVEKREELASERFKLLRLLICFYLAFLLLTIGLPLTGYGIYGDVFLSIIIFLGATAVGIAIPFMVLRREH